MMNYKKKGLIFSFFLVIIIQIILLINNKQKTSIKYFIWNFQDVTIGRLIFISFVSGLLMSSILNKSLKYKNIANPNIELNDKTTNKIKFPTNREDNNEPHEMTPERDLRDTQPTISVNYRVIKNNEENDLKKDKNQKPDKSQYEDDWRNNESEW